MNTETLPIPTYTAAPPERPAPLPVPSVGGLPPVPVESAPAPISRVPGLPASPKTQDVPVAFPKPEAVRVSLPADQVPSPPGGEEVWNRPGNRDKKTAEVMALHDPNKKTGTEGAPLPPPSFSRFDSAKQPELPLPAPVIGGAPLPAPALPAPSNGGVEKFELPALPAVSGLPQPKVEPAPVVSPVDNPPARPQSISGGFRESAALPAPGGFGTATVVPTGGTGPTAIPASVGSSDPTPKTDFDVDVTRVRSGDTYTSISEKFYGTKQYATALRTFNKGAELTQLREVMVPPMHVIRKQVPPREDTFPSQERGDVGREDRAVIPASAVRGPVLEQPVSPDSTEDVAWGTPGQRRPTVKYEKFTTPREGMTARDVAKAVYDNDRDWTKLTGPRGARLRADDPLPRGTELTVPREELPWK